MIQPQLLHIALNPRDVVYTPLDVARDVVNFFKPTGRILEPCAGDGAFLKYLPEDTEWCEIEKGRDFFALDPSKEHYDWIIGNPPFSNMNDWMQHAFEIADNVVFLMVGSGVFNSMIRQRMIRDYGNIRTVIMLGTSKEIFSLDAGYAAVAVHFQRGYRGGTFTVFRNAPTS